MIVCTCIYNFDANNICMCFCVIWLSFNPYTPFIATTTDNITSIQHHHHNHRMSSAIFNNKLSSSMSTIESDVFVILFEFIFIKCIDVFSKYI